MTAPDLVDVVAKALGTHLAVRLAAVEDGFYIECRCGEIGQIESDAADWEPANQWHVAHQARAVLDALAEAGTVQFDVRWHVDGCSGIDRCTGERHAERQAAKLVELGHEATVVSRLTLPWTAVK